jgi:hypothetical protein
MDDRKQVTVYVLKTPKGYLIRPAAAAVARGGRIRFVNLTHAEALVHLPSRALGRREEVLVLPPQSKEKDCAAQPVSIDVPGDTPYGTYAYSVYSDEAHDYCQGESSPIIIIDE